MSATCSCTAWENLPLCSSADTLMLTQNMSATAIPQNGNPSGLWSSADAAQQPLLEALDVLIKRSSWKDSITAVLLLPLIKGLRHLGAFALWLSSWIIKRRTRGAK